MARELRGEAAHGARIALDAGEYQRAASATIAALARHLEAQTVDPVVPMGASTTIAAELARSDWHLGGMSVAEHERFLDAYLARSTRLGHPGSLAHQVAVPDIPAAVADIVHGAINNPMAIFEEGPAAAVVEGMVVDWMLSKVGWGRPPASSGDPRAGGVLTHGGSLANLTALLAARAAAEPDAWTSGTPDDLVLLAPPSSHYSVARAASIMGLGGNAVWPLATDAREVLLPEGVDLALQRVAREGKRCIAVVVNACSTSTGLFDPIAATAEVCRRHAVWLHVDGAHGASFLLSTRHRHLLDGIGEADSVIWDAHKMLRTPALCAAVLLRDERSFDRAFSQKASYLFYEEEGSEVDLIARTVECTKAGLGLRVFLNLAWRGEAGLAEYIEGRVDVARYAWETINERHGFEAPFEPQANILCFRYGTDDQRQLAIRTELMRRGRFHLSSTEVSGVRYLRIAVMAPETDEATIDALLDEIEVVAAA